MPLKVDRSVVNGIEVMTLHGSITVGRDAQAFEASVEELAKAGAARIVLDLTDVSFVDSAGIGILVGCHGKVVSGGGKLRMAGAGDRVLNVLRISKVDGILKLDKTVGEAVAVLG